uniref:Putative prolyl 4-hydroxylase alpha polypeptide i n=1 Tax=Ixodes ricinus TaxID=34613 RepID=A0A0K8R3R5_IXORI
MIYMTDVEEGGATVFPSLGIRLTPKKGGRRVLVEPKGKRGRRQAHNARRLSRPLRIQVDRQQVVLVLQQRVPCTPAPQTGMLPWRPWCDLFSKTSCRSPTNVAIHQLSVSCLFISHEYFGRIAACK